MTRQKKVLCGIVFMHSEKMRNTKGIFLGGKRVGK